MSSEAGPPDGALQDASPEDIAKLRTDLGNMRKRDQASLKPQVGALLERRTQ